MCVCALDSPPRWRRRLQSCCGVVRLGQERSSSLRARQQADSARSLAKELRIWLQMSELPPPGKVRMPAAANSLGPMTYLRYQQLRRFWGSGVAPRHELPPHGPTHCGLAPEVGGARALRLLVAYVLLASSTRTTTYLCRFCLCIVCARGGFAQILFAARAMSRFHAAPQGHQKATRRSEDTGLSDM